MGRQRRIDLTKFGRLRGKAIPPQAVAIGMRVFVRLWVALLALLTGAHSSGQFLRDCVLEVSNESSHIGCRFTICLLGLLLCGCGSMRPDTTITEKDLASNAERIEFLNEYVPITVPAEARNIKFTFISWQDWSLELTFVLPPNDFVEFGDQLQQVARGPREFEIQIQDTRKGSQARVRLDAKDNSVWIRAMNMRGR